MTGAGAAGVGGDCGAGKGNAGGSTSVTSLPVSSRAARAVRNCSIRATTSPMLGTLSWSGGSVGSGAASGGDPASRVAEAVAPLRPGGGYSASRKRATSGDAAARTAGSGA
ncbi:hypothetical protein [Sphingomonas sp.]|uniref:hypothetical protein n=1 Tax=Sphingomonas sp. TaxID=28214 RepID=UPI00286C7205|nr:hypothetical protein [Sphingomonas sp.]